MLRLRREAHLDPRAVRRAGEVERPAQPFHPLAHMAQTKPNRLVPIPAQIFACARLRPFCPVQVEAMSVVRDPQGDGARRAHDGYLGLSRPAMARGVAERFLDDAKELLLV